MRFDRKQSGPNEVFEKNGEPYERYRPVLEEIRSMGTEEWDRRTQRAHELLLEEQRSFGITEGDKTHPIDYLPRVVSASDWKKLERGTAQWMRAINEFLRRLEAGKEEVVPKEVIASSTLYDPDLPTRFGEVPARQAGFDIVALEDDGGWRYVFIEDNIKMPVGLVPMSRMRTRTAEVLPNSYSSLGVRPLDGILKRLGDALRAASPKGPEATLAVLTDGPSDQYYLDHNILAEETGAVLAERRELEMEDGYLIHGPTGRRLDVIYERIEEGRIYDDFPDLMHSHAEGKAHAIFPPNADAADDKGIYPFIPDMIRTYLGEEPIIDNARTFSLAVEDDYRYVMDHFDELVIKSRSGWGGKDVLIAPDESKEDIEEFRQQVEKDPVQYIAQTILDFSTHVFCGTEENVCILRDSYADYRMQALCPDPENVEVVPGALTRVAGLGSRLVNISSGGAMKDTWVLGSR
ncbi:MAG TPA: circularly permuted type 2 ATP-grasp protein [Rubrobacteraceae bacterium]|nr:circularly permuted type 2 ATP-grasp protein [Rubrobacteraceae bacterium]